MDKNDQEQLRNRMSIEIPGIKKGRTEDCTIGPVPIMGLVAILRQLREQNWKISFVAFSGMIMMQEKILAANRNGAPVPSYVIIAEKFFNEGEEFVPPTLRQAQGPMDGPK